MSYQNNVQKKRGKVDAYSAQGAFQRDNQQNNNKGYYNRQTKKESDQKVDNIRNRHLKVDNGSHGNQAEIANALHMKNKTMSNISIIDRISERQNRMEEKYFNQEIKQKRKSATNQNS